MLAALLFDAGHVVASDALIDRVWGGSPPSGVHNVVYTHISRIRRLLTSVFGTEPPPLSRRSGGYVLEIDREHVDLHRFRHLVADARVAGNSALAATTYREAFALWRGSFCADLPGVWFDLVREELDGERVAALANCLDAELALGRHSDVLPELRALAAAHPLDERLAGQAMLAAYRSGRQAEALDCYEQIRRGLADELGVDPGPDLQQLYRRMLHNDPALAATAEADSTSARAQAIVQRLPAQSEARPAPAQLPHDVAAFAGRDRELAILHRLVPDTDAAAPGTAVVIAAITGTAGVGKSALAVRWAHQVRDRFPDGQLYVNLRGYAPTAPMRPIEALAGFLHAFGVPAEQIPVDEQNAAALYRSLLADRRVLVVLDNAQSAEQVRPLLPGSPGCLALVTSRDRLGGLVARDGASRLTLDVLTPDEAREVLAGVLGDARLAAEPAASARLISLCAQLPLALRIAAAALTDSPRRGIAGYVAELAAGNRLAALAVGGDEATAVRAAFDLSYATLSAPAQRLFRRLALVPGHDFTPEATAVLAETAPAEARRLLDRLAGEHLLEQHAPGRYTFHDLLRAYAAERVQTDDAADQRDAATRRLYDWYLHSIDAAARLLYPQKVRLPVPPAQLEPRPCFSDHADALGWLDAERSNIVVAIQHTAEHGPRQAAWLLADGLRSYFWRCRYLVDWLAAAQGAVVAAEIDGDGRAQAAAQFNLGDVHRCQGQYPAAIEHYSRARALARRAAWSDGEAATLTNLGIACREAGRLTRAAEHYRDALVINKKHGRLHGAAITHTHLGLLCHELGRLHQAAEHLTTGLGLQRQAGRRLEVPVDLGRLADTYHALGRFDEAVEHLAEALGVHRELGCRAFEAENLRILAEIHRDRGSHRQAIETARSALALARETGDRRVEADALNTLASVYGRLAQADRAIEHHRHALRVAREIDGRYPEVLALIGLARTHRDVGRLGEARANADHALDLARQAGYRVLEGHSRTALAELNLALGRPRQALHHAKQARDIQHDTGHRLGHAGALVVLGHALRRTDGIRPAERCWQQALAIFTDVGAAEADQVRPLLEAPDRFSREGVLGHGRGVG